MTSKIKVNILADGGDNSIITSDGAGSFTASSSLASSVQSVGGIQMTPAFHVAKSGNQDIPDDTSTKITGWTEVLDTDNCFASNRFTPTTAGKYVIYGAACVSSVSTVTNLRAAYSMIYKNGSSYAVSDNNYNGSFIFNATLFVQAIVDFNGSTDYVEFYGNGDLTSGNPRILAANATVFGGYRIIGA
jgi:hypothetical protein